MADHIHARVEKIISEKGKAYWFKNALHYPKAAFGSESGGMNELAWQLYRVTGNAKYASLGSLFDHPTFLANMAADKAGSSHSLARSLTRSFARLTRGALTGGGYTRSCSTRW